MANCNCGSTSSTTSTTSSSGDCGNPSSCQGQAGAAYCDSRLANLPKADAIKLVGVNGECLYEFAEGSRGIVYFDGQGQARVSEAPCLELPALLEYLQDSGSSDGLARKNGSLIEGAPPSFNHLLVLSNECDICGSVPCWFKWRGQEDLPGYVYWNGENFTFGQINEEGVETSAILSPYTEGYLPLYPSTIDPRLTGRKVQGYAKPATPDLFYVGSDGIMKPLNEANDTGFVVFEQESECGETITPQVRKLCDITNPACSATPVPLQLVGCDEAGNPASTQTSPSVPTGSCTTALISAGDGAPIQWALMGLTFYPGSGNLRAGIATAGSVSETITKIQIEAAAGYSFPQTPDYYLFWVKLNVSDKLGDARKTASITLGGIEAADISAYSWDSGTTVDIDSSISTVIVPAGTDGNVAFNLSHSVSDTGVSEINYTVNLAGALVCPTAQ